MSVTKRQKKTTPSSAKELRSQEMDFGPLLALRGAFDYPLEEALEAERRAERLREDKKCEFWGSLLSSPKASSKK